MASGKVSRRGFMQTAGVVGSALLAPEAFAQEQAKPMPTAILGRTGETVSRLGVGCGMLGRHHVTEDDVYALLARAAELGVNYIDTAPNYSRGDQFAEVKMGPGIRDMREKFFLVTKVEEASYDGAWRLMRQSMERMQTDRLDLVHIHNVGLESRFPDMQAMISDKGALGALREAKAQGVIRFIGASGHVWPSRYHQLLDTGEIDVLMNAVNYIVQHTYDFESKIWSRAREANIGLVAMKVLGGGGPGDKGFRFAPEMYDKSVRYALSLPKCATAVIGVDSVAQLEQAAEAVRNFTPLTPEEQYDLAQLGLKEAQTDAWRAAYGEPLA